MKIGYIKHLEGLFLVTTGAILAVAYYAFINEPVFCSSFSGCFKVLEFGAPYQYFFLPLVSLFLSFFPFFILKVLKEQVFYTWLKFAATTLPLIGFLIWVSPDQQGGQFLPSGASRESTSMILSALFVIISYLIIIIKSLRLRHKK